MYWFLLVSYILIKESFSKMIMEITACQEHSRKFFEENIPKIVDVPLGSTVHLECNFCNIKDNYLPKLWYFKKRGSDLNFIEQELDMETNSTKVKISMTPSHTLDIHNFQLRDTGIYLCKSNDPDSVEEIFLYFLDVFFRNFDRQIMYSCLSCLGVYQDTETSVGKLSQWKEYKLQKLSCINEKFKSSNIEPFVSLRENFNFTFKLLDVWDSWGPCEAIGKHKGIRKKLGYCRLQPLPMSNTHFETALPDDNILYEEVTRYFLKDNFEISCHSITLNKTFPEISRIVRKLPNYEIIESCDTFNYIPAINNMIKTKKNAFKYKCNKHIGENSHITLTCPEVTFDSSIEWYKDDVLLNSSFRNNMADSEKEPRLTIDSYNCLYILHATKNEEAVYTCTVDGEKMQRFDVRVVSKSKLLNQEFIRYSIYLGFVLSLSLSCYCVGMCVAWHRRSSFADPLNKTK